MGDNGIGRRVIGFFIGIIMTCAFVHLAAPAELERTQAASDFTMAQYMAQCDRVQRIGNHMVNTAPPTNIALIMGGRMMVSVAIANRGYGVRGEWDNMRRVYPQMVSVPTPPGVQP